MTISTCLHILYPEHEEIMDLDPKLFENKYIMAYLSELNVFKSQTDTVFSVKSKIK